ncbi:MAG: hypothetical protein CMK59_00090 [Proteobacteria bacterium]|nr:hypothetical protein [Pseudomonadota bacterium]
MLFLFVSEAFGTAQPWRSYAAGVASTAISMPITYASAQALAGHSNKLIPGLLPSLLIGITAPATAAWAGVHWMNQRHQVEYSPWKTWGRMVGLNTIVWTAGTALGVTTDQPNKAAIYGLVTSLIVPLPSLNTKHAVSLFPTQPNSRNHSYLVQGTYSVSF